MPVLRPADPVAAALTSSAMASSFANGVFYTTSALFFVRVVGFDISDVGLALTLAGAAGVVAALGAGYLCDRVGPARVLVAATAAQGCALLLHPAVTGLPVLVVVAAVAVAGRAAQGSARAALLAQAFDGPERVLVRARLGVVINVFIGAGTVAAGLALLAGTRAAYTTAPLTAGALGLLSLRPLVALRHRPSPAAVPRRAAGSSSSPLRDRRYVALTLLNMVLAMHAGLLTVGVPLWITTRTSAPDVTVSLLLVLNTALVVVVQVRVAHRVHDLRSASRAVAAAGALLLAASGTYASTAGTTAMLAVLLLLVAVVLHTLGEVLAEVGSWGLAFDLALTGASGAYQGLNQTSAAAGAMLAPVVVTATALEHGTAGWLLLGALFAIAGGASSLVVGRTGREPAAGGGTRLPGIPVRWCPVAARRRRWTA